MEGRRGLPPARRKGWSSTMAADVIFGPAFVGFCRRPWPCLTVPDPIARPTRYAFSPRDDQTIANRCGSRLISPEQKNRLSDPYRPPGNPPRCYFRSPDGYRPTGAHFRLAALIFSVAPGRVLEDVRPRFAAQALAFGSAAAARTAGPRSSRIGGLFRSCLCQSDDCCLLMPRSDRVAGASLGRGDRCPGR